MDKRTLLFMICISIAFFGVQAWFSRSNESDRTAHLNKIEAQRTLVQKEREIQIAARVAKIEDLPLAILYADAKGKEQIALGLKFEGHYLSLSWKKPQPEKVYVSKGETFEQISLASSVESLNDPVIYSRPGAAPLLLPDLASTRPIDLQLVALKPLDLETPIRIALGEQRGDEFSTPFDYLGDLSIALLKEENSYLPVGIFEPDAKGAKRIRPLREFAHLKEIVLQPKSTPLAPSSRDETFYVLENTYQQLVFSTKGGSLAEINLPLKTSKDSKSIVKEIDVDRTILEKSPQNAHFPLHPYYEAFPTGPLFKNEGALGGYYPLLRRSLLSGDGSEKNSVPPEYYALNIVGDDPQIANLNYTMTRFEPNLIQFQASTGRRQITKTYTIPQERNGPYCFNLEVQIEGDASGLWLGSGIPDVELVGGSYSPLLKFQMTRGKESDVDTIDLPKKGPLQVGNITPNWISNCNGFLGIIIDPLTENVPGYQVQQIDGAKIPTRLSLIDPGYNLYPPANYPGYATYLPLKAGATPFRIFAGPFDDSLLKELDDLYEDRTKNYNPDYASAQSIQGWFSFISQPFAKFLFLLMQFFYLITHSWALAIILLTIALKAMMYPLNAWSIRSSIKMQEIAPKVKVIQERYKKDPRKAQTEVMNLYKESGVNPITGCFPVLLQMPFLIGMFYLLKSSFPLRGAVFIPGWIDDLAAPDVLFTWNQPIWFIGTEFHLLPILMGITMYLQQRLTSKLPKDGTPLNDAQKQQKMMGNMMSVLFTVMFYNFPSGLNIYFMFSTILGLLQQAWMMKKMKPAESPRKG
ncbi:MAG: membrane protein insertase YidC [Chlamydiota bacterium]